MKEKEFYIKMARKEAVRAIRVNEVPVGVVIELHGVLVGLSHNLVEHTNNPTAHAEIIAINQASELMTDWRLNGAQVFVTKKPCIMCMGAIAISRVYQLNYLINDSRLAGIYL